MTQIASRTLYIWAVSMIPILGIMTPVFGVLWADMLYPLRIVEAIFIGLLFTAWSAASYLIFAFGNTLHHSVYFDGDSIHVSSWKQSQTFQLTPTMKAKEKSFGHLIIIVIEDQGRTVAKFLPPLDRYREIRSRGAEHYWLGLLSHQAWLKDHHLA